MIDKLRDAGASCLLGLCAWAIILPGVVVTIVYGLPALTHALDALERTMR